MGAKEKNFHLDLIGRFGFAEEAQRVQELFLSGKRAEAIAAVPEQLVDEITLVGPKERIRDRLGAWKESPVTTLLVGSQDPGVVRFMAEELL
jgi:hypothetical protein